MNKKVMILIIIGTLIIGGAAGFWIKSQNMNENDDPTEEEAQENESSNEYAQDDNYLRTLNDFILSADNSDYIVKMTVTLDFTNQDQLMRFEGITNTDESEPKSSEKADEDAALTPMEYAINGKISDLMMDANESQILHKDKLKNYLLAQINQNFSDDNQDLIDDLYIENYVVQ